MDLPTILNVALGLVVVYFLLSTIASLLLELLTTWARYREEILYVTINRLLAGQPDKPWKLNQLVRDRIGRRLRDISGLKWLGTFLTEEYRIVAPGKAANDDSDDIVQRFWRQPKIKSLVAPGADAPPSIKPDTFARVLIDVVVPRDATGALPDNLLALDRALAVRQEGCPDELRLTLRKLVGSGEIPPAATGDAMWAPVCAGIATWFEEAAKRSTEQYRQSMQWLLLGTGFILALMLNADTIRTAHLLSKDRSLQEATAAFAATFVEPPKEKASDPDAVRETVKVRAELSADIEKLRKLEEIGFPLGWDGPDRGFHNIQVYRRFQARFAEYRKASSWFDPALFKGAFWLFCFGFLKFAGLTATALAVAQGAPFWYDIMTKLLSLKRGLGTAAPAAPDEVVAVGSAAKPAAVTTVPLEIGHDLITPSEGFDPRKAYWLARASALAYAPESEIRSLVLQTWRFHGCKFLEAKDTQAFCAYDEKLVLLAFRGTEPKELNDFLTDARVALDPFTLKPASEAASGAVSGKSKVHRGFQNALNAVTDQVEGCVAGWLRAEKDQPPRRLLITGHSLGGALATLYFARIARERETARPLLYTFGCPMTGNEQFTRALDQAHPGQIFRLVNDTDIVPNLPPLPAYDHTGQVRQFDQDGKVLSKVSGLGRLLGYAAGAAKSIKDAGEKAVTDHGMDRYVAQCEKLAKPA